MWGGEPVNVRRNEVGVVFVAGDVSIGWRCVIDSGS